MHKSEEPNVGEMISVQQEDIDILEEFLPQEVARLVETRDRFLRGELNDWTDEYNRLRFVRWLYEHGKLEG